MTAAVMTGLGVAAGGAIGCEAFAKVLEGGMPTFTGQARLPAYASRLPEAAFEPRNRPLARQASRPARSALLVAEEAMTQAGLTGSERVGLVLGGHNLSLALSASAHQGHGADPGFVSPRYGLQIWDSHMLGLVSEAFGLTGPGLTVGSHFSSGLAALSQALLLLEGGHADAVLCVAPVTLLSDLEWNAFINLGALRQQPGYQPFGEDQSGFVPGEAACAIVLERADARQTQHLASLESAVILMAAHAGPEPDAAAEARVMRRALHKAGRQPRDIGYVNAHATGTPQGDAAEADAIATVFAENNTPPWVNATKAIAGHGLFAAGLLGVIATVLQMRRGFLHANPLPVRQWPGMRLMGTTRVSQETRAALCNAFGFGGLYASAVVTTGSTGGA
jgi:malonyl-ACP decarboxylase